MCREAILRATWALSLLLLCGGAALAEEARQSTSGPKPGPGVVCPPLSNSKSAVVITGVPPYLWRHGCGPTAVGMVVGYWDGVGFDDLIPGPAATQTDAVNQAIASGGNHTYLRAGGGEGHYEDYASPEDSYPDLQEDGIWQMGRPPHPDNCLADFMQTSRSDARNFYGWSWSSDIIPAFNSYVLLQSPCYAPAVGQYYYGSTLTFDVVKQEIDAGRPMVFLVDSDGNGGTDHFVTVIGYNDGPPQTYIYYDTWNLKEHETEFHGLAGPPVNDPWGVWAGWSFSIEKFLVFPSQPHGGVYAEGDRLVWTVTAQGAVGNTYYQWFKDAQPIPDATENTLILDGLTPDDAGWYVCQAMDDTGTVGVTEAVYVDVMPGAHVPAAGMGGLCAGALLFAWCAARRLVRA